MITLLTDRMYQWWNHFINECELPYAFTEKRLKKVEPHIFDNHRFWIDTIVRHGGNECTPLELKQKDINNYEHCISNMIALTRDMMITHNIIYI